MSQWTDAGGDTVTIDVSKPFARVSAAAMLEAETGMRIPDDPCDDAYLRALRRALERHSIACSPPHTPAR